MSYNEARILRYKGNVMDLAKRYSSKFNPANICLSGTKKYFVLNDGVYISLTQENMLLPWNDPEWSITLFVDSNSRDVTKETIDKIVRKFGVESKTLKSV